MTLEDEIEFCNRSFIELNKNLGYEEGDPRHISSNIQDRNFDKEYTYSLALSPMPLRIHRIGVHTTKEDDTCFMTIDANSIKDMLENETYTPPCVPEGGTK